MGVDGLHAQRSPSPLGLALAAVPLPGQLGPGHHGTQLPGPEACGCVAVWDGIQHHAVYGQESRLVMLG